MYLYFLCNCFSTFVEFQINFGLLQIDTENFLLLVIAVFGLGHFSKPTETLTFLRNFIIHYPHSFSFFVSLNRNKITPCVILKIKFPLRN